MPINNCVSIYRIAWEQWITNNSHTHNMYIHIHIHIYKDVCMFLYAYEYSTCIYYTHN